MHEKDQEHHQLSMYQKVTAPSNVLLGLELKDIMKTSRYNFLHQQSKNFELAPLHYFSFGSASVVL